MCWKKTNPHVFTIATKYTATNLRFIRFYACVCEAERRMILAWSELDETNGWNFNLFYWFVPSTKHNLSENAAGKNQLAGSRFRNSTNNVCAPDCPRQQFPNLRWSIVLRIDITSFKPRSVLRPVAVFTIRSCPLAISIAFRSITLLLLLWALELTTNISLIFNSSLSSSSLLLLLFWEITGPIEENRGRENVG